MTHRSDFIPNQRAVDMSPQQRRFGRIAHVTLIVTALAIGISVVGKIIDGNAYQTAIGLAGLLILALMIYGSKRLFRGPAIAQFQMITAFLLFFAVFLGSLQGFYLSVRYFDKYTHALLGMVLTCIGFVLFYRLHPNEQLKLTIRPGFVAFFSTCFALASKVIWELYEFFGDRILGSNMQRWQKDALSGLTDTMTDLAVGLAGSLLISFLAYRMMRQNAQAFYRNFIAGFMK